MDLVKRLEPLWLVLVVAGAIVLGVDGLFDTDVVGDVFGGGTVADVVYAVVGVAALTFVPRLMDELRLGGRGTRPHGA